MTPKQFKEPITLDGEYSFPTLKPGRQVIVEVDGTFGGGTATIGYRGHGGGFVGFKDPAGDPVTASSASSWVFMLPSSGRLALSLAGSSSPSFNLVATLVVMDEDG